MNRVYTISVAGLTRELPIVAINSNISIAFLNVIGDTELIVHASKALCKLIPPSTDFLITPETAGILLAHQMSVDSGLPYIAARKKVKPHMEEPLVVPVRSITTGFQQTLCIGQSDIAMLRGKNVVFVDEVISTGNTLAAVEEIVNAAEAKIIGRLCIAAEGVARDDIVSLCHLPLF